MGTVPHLTRGKKLAYFTIFYNLLEAAVALAAGAVANSIALIGFGLDSLIEVASGAAVLWRLHDEEAERKALRIVGGSFLALAGYVAWESCGSLWKGEAPERSLPGTVLAAVSVVVMPLLAREKRKVAGALSSETMRADARQTDFCTYLSAILLVGLLLNAALGWWWADPVAGVVMTPVIAREGWQAVQGKECCDRCR